MIEKVIDGLLALIFVALAAFSAPAIYNFVRREALMQVSKGLSSTYKYTQSLTGEHFDWEK